MSAVMIFSYLLGFGSIKTDGGYTVVRTDKLNSVLSLYAAQGICYDGENFYCSGAITAVNFTGLSKFDKEMNCLRVRTNAVPKEFTEKYGSNHIGGIDCANGYIYAPVEGKVDGKHLYNFILLYDCKTLKYTGIYYDMSSEYLTDGIPWCAIDRENGYLYISQFHNVGEILQYDLETMTFLRAIPLEEKLDRIQGGSVYNGVLYLSYDAANSTREQIIAVDPNTGSVRVEFTRYCPNYDNEAEDVCVYPMEDGSLFHVVDYDKLINANVSHYKPAEG